MGSPGPRARAGRAVWAEVDLSAISHNASVLARLAAPARLCAVVKAGAYGHGMVAAARAALAGGASWLGVALVDEGAHLRDVGVHAPVLLLSEPPPEAMGDVVALGLTPTLYTHRGIEAAAKAVAGRGRLGPGGSRGGGGGGRLPVHLKVDTGMHRVGALPDEATALALAVADRPELRLEGLWTHFAVADEPGNPFTAEQGRRLRAVLADLDRVGVRPQLVHACNSAGTLGGHGAGHDLVRCGIALYGVAPSPALEQAADLRPALSLRARVSFVKEVPAGDGISYGLRYRCSRPSVIATVPIGYADGVPWRLSAVAGEVLLGGRRRPIAGSVTMDQITLDCGEDRSVAAGDEVVLLGGQGDERVEPWEWAGRLGTIAYEVLCGIGPRVPRVYR